MRGTSRDKYGVSHALSNGPTLYTVLLVKPLSEVKVQIEKLVVDRISPRDGTKTSLLVDLTERGRSK